MRAQMQEKRSQLLSMFVLMSAGVSAIAILATTPISGLIFYLPFSALSLSWLLSDIKLDPIAKICIAVLMIGLGFYLSSLPLITQTIIGALTTGLLSFYFFRGVWRSQDTLNTELQKAASDSNLEQVIALKARGADPYAANAEEYNAFHCAIKNHDNAPLIINALRQGENAPDPSLINLLPKVEDFIGREGPQRQQFSQTWNNLFESIKTLFRNDNFSENIKQFYQSFGAVYELYAPIFSHSLEALAHFLRHQMACPRDLQARNNANQTALDLIPTYVQDNYKISKELAEALTRAADPVPVQLHHDPEFNYQTVVTGAKMVWSTVAATATQRPSAPAPSTTQDDRRNNSTGPAV